MSKTFEVGDLCKIVDDKLPFSFFKTGSIVQVLHVEDSNFFFVKLVLGAPTAGNEDMVNRAVCFREELEHI